MTEHVLVWHPKVPGDAPADSDDQLRLIGMPTGLVRAARQTPADEELTAASRAVMISVSSVTGCKVSMGCVWDWALRMRNSSSSVG